MTFFDLIAPFYNSLMRRCGFFQVTEVLAALPGLEHWRLADLGGGTGVYARALAAEGACVTLVDSSARMLARARPAPGVIPCRAEAASTGLAGGAFDAVLLIDLLHHLRNRQAVLREAVRLLRPAGLILVLEVPADGNFRARLRRFGETFFCPPDSFLTPAALAAELAELGVAELQRKNFSSSFLYLGKKR